MADLRPNLSRPTAGPSIVAMDGDGVPQPSRLSTSPETHQAHPGSPRDPFRHSRRQIRGAAAFAPTISRPGGGSSPSDTKDTVDIAMAVSAEISTSRRRMESRMISLLDISLWTRTSARGWLGARQELRTPLSNCQYVPACPSRETIDFRGFAMTFRYAEDLRRGGRHRRAPRPRGPSSAPLLADLRRQADRARHRRERGLDIQRLQPVYAYEELDVRPFREFLALPGLRDGSSGSSDPAASHRTSWQSLRAGGPALEHQLTGIGATTSGGSSTSVFHAAARSMQCSISSTAPCTTITLSGWCRKATTGDTGGSARLSPDPDALALLDRLDVR